MKGFIEDTIKRLHELNRLEDRLCTIQAYDDANNVRVLVESLRASVPITFLIHHDGLRAKGSRSIAEVCNGNCSCCQIKLSPTILRALESYEELKKCEKCGRFLLFGRDSEAAASFYILDKDSKNKQ